jgi:hypothetical protein
MMEPLTYRPIADPKTKTYARNVSGTDTLLGAMKLFFRFPTPRLILVKILAALAVRLWVGGWSAWDVPVVLAVCVYWPFQEWLFHMVLLHFKPRRLFGWVFDPAPARTHRYHHLNPDLLETTFIPWFAITCIIPVNVLLWFLMMPTLEMACTGILFFSCAALIYEWVHYLAHTPYKPKTVYFQKVCRNHRLHHFKHEAYWHAFTVPFVDTIFGTNPDPATVSKSKTVKTLGVHADRM